jgi:hypothetical protein
MLLIKDFQRQVNAELVFWGLFNRMKETKTNIVSTVNAGRQFVICTKVTVSAHQETKEKKILGTALELRQLNIPHYFVLGKQKAKMHDDLQEFCIHIVFESNAPVNQNGIEFPPQNKQNAEEPKGPAHPHKPKKPKNNS